MTLSTTVDSDLVDESDTPRRVRAAIWFAPPQHVGYRD
jgi:hypothetical protein